MVSGNAIKICLMQVSDHIGVIANNTGGTHLLA